MPTATREPMLREVNLTQARNLSPLFDEAVRRERPVLIVRGRRERGLLLARDALLRLLAPYQLHVDVLPEDEGGFTLWLRELNIAGTGPSLREARQDLLAAIRSYVRDYLAQFDFYQHLPDLARQEPYVLRLALAQDDAELIDLLFGAREAEARATA